LVGLDAPPRAMYASASAWASAAYWVAKLRGSGANVDLKIQSFQFEAARIWLVSTAE